MKVRLDGEMVRRGLASSRSQAGNFIRLSLVTVDSQPAKKSGQMVGPDNVVKLLANETYVSRAGLKLASVAKVFGVDFRGKVVLDVGSSTGGFTDYALQHGARLVYAVDVGTEQLHPKLRGDERVELHEKTDIRDFYAEQAIDVIVGDVSFISLRDILPHVAKNLMQPNTLLVAMVKPQFEATRAQLTKHGIVKNDRIRREILSAFEQWVKQYAVIVNKADSEVPGTHGNKERFYQLKPIQTDKSIAQNITL